MTASTVWINGAALGEYKGGFTPFSFELTPHLRPDGENVLVVSLDSTERNDMPPFGYEIDYMTFGGIYREVSLRVVPETYLDNIFARPLNVLTDARSLEVDCFLAGAAATGGRLSLEVELKDGDRTIAKREPPGGCPGQRRPIPPPSMNPPTSAPAYTSFQTRTDPARHTLTFTGLHDVQLWDLDHPHLYTVHVRLLRDGKVHDEDTRRIGFREAVFTEHGFSLNGTIVKLRGLDRHQTFPFVGQAMPARVQRQDAKILRKNLHCNIVRTLALPTVASLSRRLRRDGAAGAGRDSRLAAHRQRGVEARRHRQCWPHDSPRLEPSVHRAVGHAHQRVARRPRASTPAPTRSRTRSTPRGRTAASAPRRPRSFWKMSSR